MTARTFPGEDEWSFAEVNVAAEEGWCISDADGSENGRTQLQSLDHMGIFADDDGAWRHVRSKAAEGSRLHQRALKAIRNHNPTEFVAIMSVTTEG